jgi:hypothetical protein
LRKLENLALALLSLTPEEEKIDDDTWASVRNMNPAIKHKLIAEIEAGPKPRDIREVAREAAAETRRIMLNRGLADAEVRGDASKAAKYRKAIVELPTPGLKVWRDDGGKSVLEIVRQTAIVAVLPDDFRRVLHPDGEISGQEDYLDRSE